MKIYAQIDAFDVWELFIHDSDDRHTPFSEAALEAAINSYLEAAVDALCYQYVRVVPEGECGLDRWILAWMGYRDSEEQRLTKRLYSKREAREAFPPDLVPLFDRLNQESIVLGESNVGGSEK